MKCVSLCVHIYIYIYKRTLIIFSLWHYLNDITLMRKSVLWWHCQSSVIIVLYLRGTQHRYHDNWKWTVHSSLLIHADWTWSGIKFISLAPFPPFLNRLLEIVACLKMKITWLSFELTNSVDVHPACPVLPFYLQIMQTKRGFESGLEMTLLDLKKKKKVCFNVLFFMKLRLLHNKFNCILAS